MERQGHRHTYQERRPLDLIEINTLQKKQKDQRCFTKGKNAKKPEGKYYNCGIKGHYICKCRKPKKDNYQTAATTSKAKKSLKDKKPETGTGKTKEIHLLVKNVNRDSNLDNSLEVSEED